MSDLQELLELGIRYPAWMEPIVKAARRVANGKPVIRMGGLSPAYYITDDPAEADAWLIEREDIPE